MKYQEIINELSKKYEFIDIYNAILYKKELSVGEYSIEENDNSDFYKSHIVVYFKEHDVYIKISITYTSVYGDRFDDIREVFPEVVTKTIFKDK